MNRKRLGEKTLGEFLAPYRRALQGQGGQSLYARCTVSWIERVALPLASALSRYLTCSVEFRGPFGLKSRFSLDAPGRNGVELVWMGPEHGIGRTDYSDDRKEYPPGTIGFWNGLNYPDFPLPETMTVADLAAMILSNGQEMSCATKAQEV
jgi:hypothetical protein